MIPELRLRLWAFPGQGQGIRGTRNVHTGTARAARNRAGYGVRRVPGASNSVTARRGMLPGVEVSGGRLATRMERDISLEVSFCIAHLYIA